MKYNSAVIIILLLLLFAFSACRTKVGNEPSTEDLDITKDYQTTEIPDYRNPVSELDYNDVGKTLSALKNAHPEAEIFSRDGGFPDAGVACFGEEDIEYTYCFFGGQSGDFIKAMNELEKQLKCAGFCTEAGVIFPEMEDDMSIEDFFSLIGVSDYTILGKNDDTTAQGWLRFTYNDMDAWLNTNEVNNSGGWEFTGNERVRDSAPVTIVDEDLFGQNQELADAIMFE